MKTKHLLHFGITALFGVFSNSLFCQEISKVGEIYDFEIGDKFHYDVGGGTWPEGSRSKVKVIVIDKYYSSNNDTLYYELDRQVNAFDHLAPPGGYLWRDSVSLSYFNLDSLINNGNIDSAVSDSDLFNGRTINYFDSINDNTSEYFTNLSEKYVRGCGRAYFREESNDGLYLDFSRLAYFKKGIEEWGTPYTFIITGIDKNGDTDIKVHIYPNPAINELTLESDNGNIRFHKAEIYSLNGKLLNEFEMNGVTNKTINIADLEGGVYVLKLYKDNNSVLLKKVVKLNY